MFKNFIKKIEAIVNGYTNAIVNALNANANTTNLHINAVGRDVQSFSKKEEEGTTKTQELVAKMLIALDGIRKDVSGLSGKLESIVENTKPGNEEELVYEAPVKATKDKEKTKRPHYSEEEYQLIAKLYKEGKSDDEIVATVNNVFGVTRNPNYLSKVITNTLKLREKTPRRSYKKKESTPKNTFLTDHVRVGEWLEDELEMAIRLFFRGNTYGKIGKIIGRKWHAVRDKLNSLNIYCRTFDEVRNVKGGEERTNSQYTDKERADIVRYIDKYHFSAEVIGIILHRTKDAIIREARNNGYSTKTVGNKTVFTKLQKVA